MMPRGASGWPRNQNPGGLSRAYQQDNQSSRPNGPFSAAGPPYSVAVHTSDLRQTWVTQRCCAGLCAHCQSVLPSILAFGYGRRSTPTKGAGFRCICNTVGLRPCEELLRWLCFFCTGPAGGTGSRLKQGLEVGHSASGPAFPAA